MDMVEARDRPKELRSDKDILFRYHDNYFAPVLPGSTTWPLGRIERVGVIAWAMDSNMD